MARSRAYGPVGRAVLNILYQSDNFVAVCKPHDLKINSDDPEEFTVEHLLRERSVCGYVRVRET